MHGDHRALRDHIQVAVGDDHGDLDDAVAVGIEAGHFHVQPDEVILVLCHNRSLFR
jgi:hypothetical protein